MAGKEVRPRMGEGACSSSQAAVVGEEVQRSRFASLGSGLCLLPALHRPPSGADTARLWPRRCTDCMCVTSSGYPISPLSPSDLELVSGWCLAQRGEQGVAVE